MTSPTRSTQYPPPPDGRDPHYTPIYSTSNHQPLDDHPSRASYAPEPAFHKLESINEVLQAQQALHTNHAMSESPTHLQHPQLSPLQAQQNRPNRLRKACDSCSIRKVKCDASGPPCRACVSLEIPCTFERPSRRRGPPNRHAEAIKKRRLDEFDPVIGNPPSQSPINAAHALAQLQSSQPTQLSAEAICSLPTIQALIDDFFVYIHPLVPFPHEPSFREAWERREDLTNSSFLALLASMIATLVASFPRKPRLYLKTQTRHQYPSHLALVDKCREVCAQARGPGYLDRPSLNVYDACTSYFLGITGAYVFQFRHLRLYFAECLTILRALGLHKTEAQSYTYLGGVPSAWGSNGPNFEGSRDIKLDHITEQIGRRLFWIVYVGARTIQHLGASFGELTILPSTPTEPYPPLPAEVDDIHIFPNEIQPQPAGTVSIMTGFCTNIRIYLTYATVATVEVVFGVDELFDWDRQQHVLYQSLLQCKHIFDNLPSVLKVEPKAQQEGEPAPQRQPYYPPTSELHGVRNQVLSNFGNTDTPADPPLVRRFEIQKANIYGSNLATRSFLVEKYFTLQEKHRRQVFQASLKSPSTTSPPSITNVVIMERLVPETNVDSDAIEGIMTEERDNVIKDLLVMLGSIEMVNMEPNADSFVQKIRSVASTLLERPRARRSSVSQKNQDYLWKFLDILSKLERISPENSDPAAVATDEELELRLWADLKGVQQRFREQGGIFGYAL